MGEEKVSRRKWLGIAGGTIAGLVVGGAAGYLMRAPEKIVETVTSTVAGPTVTKTIAGPTVTTTVAGKATTVTKTETKTVTTTVGVTTKKPTSIKIGMPHPFSGDAAWYGKMSSQGAILAMEEINEKGGVLDLPIELVMEDGKCIPSEGIAAFKKLITEHGVKFSFGGLCSSVTLSIAPIAQENEVLIISSSSSHPDVTMKAGIGGWDLLFSLYPRDDERAYAMIKYIIEEKGDKKLAFINIDNDYGWGVYKAAEAATKEYGGEVVSSDFHKQGETEFSGILTKIKGLNPDAIIFNTYIEEGARMMRQAYELGVFETVPDKYSFCCLCNEKVLGMIGPDIMEGLEEIEAFEIIPGTGTEEFAKKYSERWGGERPVADCALPYLDVQIFAKAIEDAGTLDVRAVQAALRRLKFSYFGMYDFYFDVHNHAHLPTFIKRMEKGEIKVVKSLPPSPVE